MSAWSLARLPTLWLSRPAPWICRQCARSRFQPSRRLSSTWHQRIRADDRHRKAAVAATAVLITGAATLAFSEEARHTYVAAQRSGRVVITLALCVGDYYWVLWQADHPEYQSRVSACHQRCAERTLHAMEKNGSIFIKLGQHLSSLNYLLPSEWCDTFIPLQDKCPVSKLEAIEDMVKHDTGHELDEYFSEFGKAPIGAASLAQVHIARLKQTGEKVAVKVQHPSLDEWSKLDIALTRMSFRTLRYWFPEYDLTWLSEELEISLPQELDFKKEAANATRVKEYFSKLPNLPLVIPAVKWADRRILVMEFVPGHRLDDLAFLDSQNIDRDDVSAALAKIFNEMIFGYDAPLHCDPHGGNLAIRKKAGRGSKNFEIILYDHGLYRDIPLALQRAYAHLWLAVLHSDEPAMRRYAYEVAGVDDSTFEIFKAAITGPDFSAGLAGMHASSEKIPHPIVEAMDAGDLLTEIVRLLGRVPRVILLILKTNDLTRSLDENLQTRLGPMRSVLILAKYCARTVLGEDLELCHAWSKWDIRYWGHFFLAWARYMTVGMELWGYEAWLKSRRGFVAR
ncbi:ABC1-domain-containing protein [Piedraia hortae CBS 480.64]|uniref:ABC1-domain-containing protein n=1 Tax=Piedraia hortae CBS 480.64 TaxID=1314780 RepID=A0A6A7CA00_9PEZI|nr:ABC1-domain-containing protein [Piedraia hortae CBS 480.64]